MKRETPLIKTLLVSSIIMLLLGTFFSLPYGYYTLLRIVICGVSGLVALAAYKFKEQKWAVTMSLIALLFNPIIQIHLKKATWVLIDLIVVVLFIALLFKVNKQRVKNA